MSLFISLFRVFKFAAQNFWRNIWLSFITVTILVLTLVIVNVVLVLNVVGQTAVTAVESKIDVSVSFIPDASEDIVLGAKGYLIGLPQVKDVVYKDPTQVLEDFKEKNANKPEVLESLDEISQNPFGSQLIITANNPEDFGFILESLESPEYSQFIDKKDFRDHETMIVGINNTIEQIRAGGIVIGAIFAAIAILIVFNTIRVAIYTHREEIGIMRLVGASSYFVKAPFLVEAVFYSFVAVLVMIAILYPTIGVIEPYIDEFFQTVPTGLIAYFNENFFIIFGAQFGALAVLTILSTSFAMGKYLRV